MNENRYDEVKGLSLWKDMETLQITDHSRQSMRCRFLKILIPNLHQYDIPNRWVDKLKRLFPELLPKHPDKEYAKTDFPCSMLDSWRRQSPRLKSSPHQTVNGAHKSRTERDVSGSEKSSKKGAENVDGDGKNGDSCTSTEPFMESPVVQQGGRKRRCKQSLVFDSSSESDTEKKMVTPRRSKRQLSKQSLQFDSSSESDVEEKQEKNVSTASGSGSPSAAMSADPSPSESAEDERKDDDDDAQSVLSDYDQYLLGIAKENIPSSEKSPRQNNNNAESDKADAPHEECVADTEEEEMDHDGSISVVEDRRSRLQHRRHLKKVKKAFGDICTPVKTPSPKKGKKPNLAEFVTNSHPEEILSENEDEESHNQEKDSDELGEYETIISDISKSYGLTNREVLSTIFSFNGDIEKSIAYIRLGPVLSQLEPWTTEEDKIISSTDEANIKTIGTKRGNKLIAERLQFLENFSEDFMND